MTAASRHQGDTSPGQRLGSIGDLYQAPPGGWDELTAADGTMRPHWTELNVAFGRLTREEMGQRWDLAQRLLRDNGVTYNVYGDPAGQDRPWQLDLLPLILPGEEWTALSKAVAQRAALLDAILADLYTRRALIARGLVPPAVLHGNPAFLRPCHGWLPAGGHYIQLYAADLVRGQDGRWRVLADRTESPSGTGYALENRTVLSRVLPEVFRTLPVERLGPFFDTLRRSLQAASPRRTDEPRLVLLTPGPYSDTYFEHAFLARHLGIPLVQGEDLTVRDNNVYVKTLTGLQPVDVILRRTNSEWCDPLELRGDSTLGVAGLLQSARAGNVAVVNALGSGLIDGAALMGSLPTISRWLLSEELQLPSVESWWCGAAANRSHALANMDRLIFRSAFSSLSQPLVGAAMSQSERDWLAQTIAARPWEWVAQDLGGLSTTPVWSSEGRLEPQHLVLRVFATAAEKGWQVMAGGLARVSAERDLLTGRLQSGGGSKDLWVLSDTRGTAPVALRMRATAVKLTRGNRDLPSRVADNAFWLGRYLERSETTTRLLRAALRRMEEAFDQGDDARAQGVLATMARLGLPCPPATPDAPLSAGALIRHHLDDDAGLSAIIERLLRVVAHLRDRLSIDTWRALNRLHEEIGALGEDFQHGDASRRLNSLVLIVEAVNGLSMENMTRGPLWQFMDVGRRLERSVNLVDTLGGALADASDEEAVPLDLLLEIWDSVMTYRSRYLAQPRLAAVLDLLLCDESNPRSLGFQLAALSDHMDRLATTGKDTGFYRQEQRLMTILCGTVRTTDAVVLAMADHDDGFHDAERLLESFRSRLWELSEVISREYFTHAQWRLPTPPVESLP